MVGGRPFRARDQTDASNAGCLFQGAARSEAVVAFTVVLLAGPSQSLSMSISSGCSSTSFFNRWFSPSSRFKRLASSAFIPP